MARTLAKALPALKHQIELALTLERQDAREPANANRRTAAEIARLFAAALPKVRAALDKDVRTAFANDPSAKSIDEVIFCFPGVAAIMRHRLAHELYRLGAPLLARIVAEIAHALAGVDIHPGAEIEEGFFIDHGTASSLARLRSSAATCVFIRRSRWGRSASRSAETANCAKAIRAIRSSKTTWSFTLARRSWAASRSGAARRSAAMSG